MQQHPERLPPSLSLGVSPLCVAGKVCIFQQAGMAGEEPKQTCSRRVCCSSPYSYSMGWKKGGEEERGISGMSVKCWLRYLCNHADGCPARKEINSTVDENPESFLLSSILQIIPCHCIGKKKLNSSFFFAEIFKLWSSSFRKIYDFQCR